MSFYQNLCCKSVVISVIKDLNFHISKEKAARISCENILAALYGSLKKTLFLVVSVNRVVDGIVKTTALLALYCHAGDEITYIDHIAELAELLAYLHTLEEILGLFVKKVEAVPGTLQAKVAAHDAHVVAHAFANFLDALGNQYLLLVGQGTLVVPCRNLLIEVVFIHMLQTVLGSSLGIYHSFDERVAGKTVATMQTGAGAFAQGIETVDA